MKTAPGGGNDDWANGLDQFEAAFGGNAGYSAPPAASDDPWGNQQSQTAVQTLDDPWGQTQETYDNPPPYQTAEPDTPGWNTPFGNTKNQASSYKLDKEKLTRIFRIMDHSLLLHRRLVDRIQLGMSSSTQKGSITSSLSLFFKPFR